MEARKSPLVRRRRAPSRRSSPRRRAKLLSFVSAARQVGISPFDAGTAYVADLKGVVHAVGLSDGAANWKLDLGAHPKVQAPNCDLALAQGTGGSLGVRHGSATVIMEREA